MLIPAGYLIRSCPSTLSHRLIELLEHWILLYDESKMDTCSVKVKIPKEKSLTSDFAIPNDKKLDCRLFFNCLQESELGPRLIQYIIETTRQTSCHVEFYGNVIGLLTKLIDCSNEIRKSRTKELANWLYQFLIDCFRCGSISISNNRTYVTSITTP